MPVFIRLHRSSSYVLKWLVCVLWVAGRMQQLLLHVQVWEGHSPRHSLRPVEVWQGAFCATFWSLDICAISLHWAGKQHSLYFLIVLFCMMCHILSGAQVWLFYFLCVCETVCAWLSSICCVDGLLSQLAKTNFSQERQNKSNVHLITVLLSPGRSSVDALIRESSTARTSRININCSVALISPETADLSEI